MNRLHKFLFTFVWYCKLSKYINWRKRVQSLIYFFKTTPMRVKGYIVKCGNSKFYLPYYTTDLIQKYIYENKKYFEQSNLDYVCKKWENGIVGKNIHNGEVLDIGTNIGNHTLYFINECGASMVHCFEPIKSTLHLLQRNIQINNISCHTKVYETAVGSKSGNASVHYFDMNNIGATGLIQDANGNLPVISIDELTFSNKIVFIKIDVEGFEFEVIKGLINTVKVHRPHLMTEIRDEYLNEVKKIFSNLNYSIEIIKSFKEYGYSDYLLFPND